MNSYKNIKILIVDDDRYIRESIKEILEDKPYQFTEAGDGKTALDLIKKHQFELILLDLELPRIKGMEILKYISKNHILTTVIIISGKGTIPIAVETMKLGAYDFLVKPLEAQRTILTIHNAIEKIRLSHEKKQLLNKIRSYHPIIGSSPAIKKVIDLIRKVAPKDSKVLIHGETGTGKELVANAIHVNSTRAAGPFVGINCAIGPETMIESELFGHEKGAFTGAINKKIGCFEQADGGTLFLDEVTDTSLMMQAKLLRVLENNIIRRLGGNEDIYVDVRVIAATNKDINQEIKKGNFREDLYYRLNTINIPLPSLRERKEDIPQLVDHFLNSVCTKNKINKKKLDSKALKVLLDFEWPGNIRQLINIIDRIVILNDKENISAQEVYDAIENVPYIKIKNQDLTLKAHREQCDKEHIRNILIANDWKIQETAKVLGIQRSYLWKLKQKYQIKNNTSQYIISPV